MSYHRTSGLIKKIALIQMCRENINWSDLGLGLSCLKAYVNQQRPGSFDIRIYRSTDFQKSCGQEKFDLVGISTVSHYYKIAQTLAGWVRGNRVSPLILLGGPHITCAPESLADCFDYGVVGEGEQTFLDLLDGLSSGQSVGDLATIPGLLSWQNGHPILSAKRPLMENLNSLPVPDLTYFKECGAIPSIILTRGCPFHCSFCISSAMWQSKVRHLSPERVVYYLKEINEAMGGLKVCIIKDDIAFISTRYLREVFRFSERKYPDLITIPKVGYARADIFTPEYAQALKDFGFYKVVFGFESGSDRILTALKGNSATVQQNQAAINIAYHAGLVTAGHFIIGTPGETAEDLFQTYEFILHNQREGKLPSPTTTILTPFPGTRYWQVMLSKEPGITMQNFRWDRLEENGFASYYSETSGTIDEWWDYREMNQKIFLGSLPKEQFLEILKRYEPEITREQNRFQLKDIRY